MSDELARSEAFMREVHAMYPAGQLDAYVAEYERMRTELDQRVAWEMYREDCHREDAECYFNSAVQAQEFLDRDYVIPNSTTGGIKVLSAEAHRWIETGTGLVPRDRPLVLEPPTFPDPASHA